VNSLGNVRIILINFSRSMRFVLSPLIFSIRRSYILRSLSNADFLIFEVKATPRNFKIFISWIFENLSDVVQAGD
jgi:hypothetical protein